MGSRFKIEAPPSDEELKEGEFASIFKKVADGSAAQTFDFSGLPDQEWNQFDLNTEDWLDADEELEARLEGTNGNSVVHFTAPGGPGVKMRPLSLHDNLTESIGRRRSDQRNSSSAKSMAWIKRRTPKQIKEDMPPTPRGCEWRRSEEGWNLWRYWSEPGEGAQARIKKTRYTGCLSHDAWQIMKEYDHEAFLSIVGQRLRRHGRG